MIGRSISHYEITEKLGEGGMGVVYKARDSRLKRFVALKVLPPEKVTDAERKQRFVQEAQSASALNHPNIVTVYDIGQSEGVDFIAMEYVEGKTLCELIGRKGLKLNEALKYAVQIADALAKAHAAGIVHRDLKPGNVMVTPDGRVKVLDFGLAKLTEAAPASPEDPTLTEQHSTELGMIVGTASYMSPEQAEGKKVDARSDIFSFGSLLYEMLTGRRAFRRDTPALTLVAILHLEPPPLPAEVPGDLNKVMARCLRKDVARRYQHMDDVRFALEELKEESKSGKLAGIPASGRKRARLGLWAAAAAGLLVIGAIGFGFYLKGSGKGAIESIAVLPLDIRSNDADADYISDGITESVNNSLARLPGLKVIPHSVALHYKGKAMDGQKIGGELRVQAVLTGRVAQRGDDLTVNVELDDVRNGKQLWGEQYHRKLADLLAVQDDIAREVSRRLGSPLSAADEQKMAKGSTDNPEAYQLYLKGKYYTNKFTKDGFQKGIDYFNQAIAKDSNYELAYGGLAYNYINQDDWFIRPNEAAPKAREAAKRALAIDESDSDAHLSLAIETHWYEWDWAAAEREFKRAIELNPNNSDAYEYYSWYLASMGRQDEAIAAARQGQQADPLSLLANFGPGSVSVFARHWDRAIEQLRSAIELDPNYWFDHCFLGRAYEQKGQLPQAIAAFQHALDLEKDNAEIWSGLGHAYAASGNRTEAQKVLDHLKELSAHSYIAPYNVAVIYAGLGKKDQTFVWLDQAYKERSYLLAVYLTTDSRLDNLHSDPRFADLRRRIGLPE